MSGSIKSIALDGATIRFEQREGSGDPLVLVHGFGGDLQAWDDLWRALGGRRAALRYDLRGFGGSVMERETPFSHGDDLAALLDVLGISRCDLAGVSLGGGVALNFALDHPARVRRLVLVSPAPVAWEWSSAWLALWHPLLRLARSGAIEEARQLWWRNPIFDSVRDGPAGPAVLQSIERFSGRPWIADSHRPMLPDIERVHSLAMPTLLLTGGLDFPDFRLIADLIEASSPHVKRIDFADAGHLVQMERPDETARAIRAFLDRPPT